MLRNTDTVRAPPGVAIFRHLPGSEILKACYRRYRMLFTLSRGPAFRGRAILLPLWLPVDPRDLETARPQQLDQTFLARQMQRADRDERTAA